MIEPADDAYSVSLNIDAPPDPGYLREVLEAAAGCVRVANHLTADPAALPSPGDVHAAATELRLLAGLLPQLFRQLAGRLSAMHAAGGVTVTGGDYAGRPGAGTAAGMLRLDMAAAAALTLRDELGHVTELTADLGAPDPGEDGTGE